MVVINLTKLIELVRIFKQTQSRVYSIVINALFTGPMFVFTFSLTHSICISVM
jgi:hypothetical protein